MHWLHPVQYHHHHHHCQWQWKRPILIMATLNEWILLEFDFLGPRIPLLVVSQPWKWTPSFIEIGQYFLLWVKILLLWKKIFHRDATSTAPDYVFFTLDKDIFALDENILSRCNVASSRSWLDQFLMHCFVSSSCARYLINSDGSENPSPLSSTSLSPLPIPKITSTVNVTICVSLINTINPFWYLSMILLYLAFRVRLSCRLESFFLLLTRIWTFQLFKIKYDDISQNKVRVRLSCRLKSSSVNSSLSLQTF